MVVCDSLSILLHYDTGVSVRIPTGTAVLDVECDGGHSAVPLAALFVVAVLLLGAHGLDAQGVGSTSGFVDLDAVEESPSLRTDSTIVEIPFPITLRAPEEGRIGFRLRLRVMFAWNDVRLGDLEGDDIVSSLQTLTVVPGFELMIPVAERWMIRPYAQFGGLNALDVSGHRWIGSLGARASMDQDFERWVLSVGGRLEYTSIFDEDWSRTDDVTFADVGADFSFPVWFDVMGERATAGFFVITRAYFDSAELAGQEGLDLGVDSHVEVGVSFRIHDNPRLWLIKLPTWYGVGGRFAEDHRSFRVYLGFPF